MRILVTGGCGFIGRHLCKKLLTLPTAPVLHIVDNFSNSSAENHVLLDLLQHPQVKLFYKRVDQFESEQPYDLIFHLASPVGPAGVLKYAGTMAETIVSDATKLAELAVAQDIPLVAISTSEVYGCDPGDIPQREDIDKIVPAKTTVRLEYGVAKLLMEIALQNLVPRGLKVVMIRPYNTVGPGQNGDAGFVLPRFVNQALRGEPLTVFGSGEQKRTFTSVNDLVSALLRVLEARQWGEVYNVGNPNNLCTINDLARLVIRLTDSKSDIKSCDPKRIYGERYEEAWNKIPDIDKISALGWKPEESLEQIVKWTIDEQR